MCSALCLSEECTNKEEEDDDALQLKDLTCSQRLLD